MASLLRARQRQRAPGPLRLKGGEPVLTPKRPADTNQRLHPRTASVFKVGKRTDADVRALSETGLVDIFDQAGSPHLRTERGLPFLDRGVSFYLHKNDNNSRSGG
ncbi:hypothetical protein PSCLAVI8L_270031 [Pseudoclavibacter sp. 8L]|nr:hypothetical protein PSCLAVI8L_270031 [Pseudoclavibacter sp. 8L]